MKKLYEVSQKLNTTSKLLIEELIDKNLMYVGVKNNIYYVDENEVIESININNEEKLCYIRLKIHNFELDYNDTFSMDYNGVPPFSKINEFIEEWKILNYNVSEFNDVTLYLDIGNSDIEDILYSLRGMFLQNYQLVNRDVISDSDYKLAYGSTENSYTSLLCGTTIKDYGLINQLKVA